MIFPCTETRAGANFHAKITDCCLIYRKLNRILKDLQGPRNDHYNILHHQIHFPKQHSRTVTKFNKIGFMTVWPTSMAITKQEANFHKDEKSRRSFYQIRGGTGRYSVLRGC